MNDKTYIDSPGIEPTSSRLEAGEKPLEVFYSLQYIALVYWYCEIGHCTPPLISQLFHRLPKKLIKY